MDILEDNLERYGQYLDVLVLPSGSRVVEENRIPTQPAFINCPLCGAVSIRELHLKQHFIEQHSNRYAYLLVDGRIVRDAFYTEKKMDSLVVHLINIPKAKIRIEASGLIPVELDFSDKISLMDQHLRDFNTGEIHLTVHLPNGANHYSVYCGALPDINLEEIDRASSEHLFYPLNSNKEPNWTSFHEEFLRGTKHRLEKQYAVGLYEYAVGIYMAQMRQDNKDHLERALGNLSPFRTPFAVTIQRVLALRMNLFGLLRMCGKTSRFAAANDFFNERENRLGQINKNHNEKGLRDYVYAIYLDQFTEMFLDALHAYFNEDYSLLNDLNIKLETMISATDRNNRDKLLLLRARTSLKRGEVTDAHSFYQMLLDNPDFKSEAREVLDETKKK